MRRNTRYASFSDVHNSATRQRNFYARLWAVAALVFLCFALLAGRWVVLQVLRSDEYKKQAEANRISIVPVQPRRGRILDRNGVLLANSFSSYVLELTPSKVEDVDATIAALQTIIPIDAHDIRRFKRLRGESRSFDAIPLRYRLTEAEVARFAAHQYNFAGVSINARSLRQYPHGELASHLVGYIGRINQKEKEKLESGERAQNYQGATHIGKLGVEKTYETELRGVVGSEQLETTAGGMVVRRLANEPAQSGNNLMLSIDIRLQKLAEDLFENRRGALVAIDPSDGQVLALVSKPTFDPNLFVDGISHKNWNDLNGSINKPLLNRAIRGLYPPGSTYKPFMALAALELGIRTPKTIINDPGYWMLGRHRFRGHATGPTNLHRSIVKSSNAYYYSLSHEMGVQAMHDFMKPLSFGQYTGIDIAGEVRGILPSPAWKEKTYGKSGRGKWLVGETISLGIGQGYNNFTMLQLAHALATLTNGGIVRKPRLALGLQDVATQQVTLLPRESEKNMGYQPEHLNAIKTAMVGVTTDGTSRHVFNGAKYISGGKTGTAQAVTIAQNKNYNAATLAEHQRDHSLYIAFAPADKPAIALAVIVENAGYGSAAAAPIARKVLDYWLLQTQAGTKVVLPEQVLAELAGKPTTTKADASIKASRIATGTDTETDADKPAPYTPPEAQQRMYELFEPASLTRTTTNLVVPVS